MSLVQADLEQGLSTVRIKSKKTKFVEENDEAEDSTGYGHYSSVAEASRADEDPLVDDMMNEEKPAKSHHKKAKSQRQKKVKKVKKAKKEHKHTNLANAGPAEPSK